MLEIASNKPQRRRADRSSASTLTGRTRRDERDVSQSSPVRAVDPPPESRMNRIARRAHEIYEARGGERGRALEDWLQAERDIDSELGAGPGIDR